MAVAQKLRCRVERILKHGEQVYTVDLRPERLAPRFRAGQFLHLALDEYDPSGFWPESRVFSMASSPRQRERLCISYSVRGRFTARMERELAEGGRVWVKLPYGEFVIDDSRDVVLFAGGTGVTAFTAFLDHLEPDPRSRVCLVYGARRRSLLIYRDLVSRCLERVPRFDAYYFLEDEVQAETEEGGRVALDATPLAAEREFSGRIAVDTIWPRLQDPLKAKFYISGPPQMLAAISRQLREHAVPPESIQIDAWE